MRMSRGASNAVTETPLGPVELGGTDAQVEQGARERCDAELVEDHVQTIEPLVDDSRPVPESSQG